MAFPDGARRHVPPFRRFPLSPRRVVPPAAPGIARAEADALAGLWPELRAAASALGSPEQGVQLVSRLRRRVAAIAERAASRPRVRAACLDGADPSAGAGGWAGALVTLAGGEDVLGSGAGQGVPLPSGALAAADPDVVVIAPREGGLEPARARALAASPLWRELRAVREGRLVLVAGGELFRNPGPRVAEALEILAEVLHPEAFRFGHEGSGWIRVAVADAPAGTGLSGRPGAPPGP